LNISELIKHRKSVRDFQDKPVEREKIMACLDAARLAPSACNAQPWKFIVVDDPQLKQKFCEDVFGGVYSINAFTSKAPVIVTIVSEQGNFMAKIGSLLRDTRYYLIDIGISGEHFALQAEDLGLGTCWMGWFNEKAVKSLLNIPGNKKVDILIALGYASQKKADLPHRREPLDKMSSFNSY
jgi:nitroreductase